MISVKFFVFLLSLLYAEKIIFPMIIEVIKQIIEIKEETKKITCFTIACLLGIVVYLAFLLFYPNKEIKSWIEVLQLIFIGIGFTFSSGGGALVGYDSMIKMWKEIWSLLFPSNK